MHKSIDDICFVVQARLSSQRCPNKMIRPFANTSLTEISIKTILDSDFIPKDNFYLSVYEPELKAVGEKFGVNIFNRSVESAEWDGSRTSKGLSNPNPHITGMYEWWNKLPHKYVVLINACVPLLQTETIENFTKTYMESKSDGMFAVIEKKNYFWNEQKELLTPLKESAMNTKTVNKTYEAAHCLYASRLDTIGDGVWMGDFNTPGEIELFPIDENETLDVDYEWQFDLVENVYKHKKGISS